MANRQTRRPTNREGLDPTENVLALVDAESKRQDGRIDIIEKYTEKLRALENKRQDELRCAGDKFTAGMLEQSDRRQTDVASQIEKFEKRISEILTTQVESTSQLISTQLVQLTANIKEMIGGLSDRIAPLEQFRYESSGKTQGTAMMIGIIFSAVMALGSFSGLIIYIVSRPH